MVHIDKRKYSMLTEMVHYGVPKWCIMGYQNGALWSQWTIILKIKHL